MYLFLATARWILNLVTFYKQVHIRLTILFVEENVHYLHIVDVESILRYCDRWWFPHHGNRGDRCMRSECSPRMASTTRTWLHGVALLDPHTPLKTQPQNSQIIKLRTIPLCSHPGSQHTKVRRLCKHDTNWLNFFKDCELALSCLIMWLDVVTNTELVHAWTRV